MSQQSHTSFAILGAGLTGLSAAHSCERLGLAYQLFEKNQSPGGLARTVHEQGYRFDCTGHLLHLRDPELKQEIVELLGDDYRVLQRKSRVWSHGVYTEYPFQANTQGLPPKVAYECLLGFLRATQTRDQRTPANFEDYCRAHFGDAISEHFMLPYNRRLWGVAPSEINSDWCQRFVPLPELEDVVAGAVGYRRRALGYNAEFLYPLDGMGALTSALQAKVSQLTLDAAPVDIDLAERRLLFGDRSLSYDRLISSMPLPQLLRLCRALPREVAQAGRALRSTHLYYLDLALSAPCLQDWHWVYVPEDKYPFYRVGCYSNFSPRMAPPGGAGLYVELAERSAPDLETLLPRIAQHLLEMQVISSADQVLFARLRRIEHAYVIFDAQHREATQLIHRFLEQHSVCSTGRYGEWTYSSMEDALLAGRRAVLSGMHSPANHP